MKAIRHAVDGVKRARGKRIEQVRLNRLAANRKGRRAITVS